MPDFPTHLRDLVFDPDNARRHTPANLGVIGEALQEVGPARSIVIDEDNVILAGNATVEAAGAAGIEDVVVHDRATGQTGPIPPDGRPYLLAVRVTGLDDRGKRRLALYDNRAAELAEWDEDVLAHYDPADVEGIFTPDALAAILDGWLPDGEGEDGPALDGHDDGGGTDDLADTETGAGADASSGELLKLVDVTIAEPRHTVERGERWRVGRHLLICAPVTTDPQTWAGELLEPGTLFCPYPGPFVPLTLRADQHRLVMVQPNPYIAGHILDRFAEVRGESEVSRVE